ncbi:MBL fold metallo-hydrolase [bacterium]|nr:MBL fold metallo-hydrolase [bacterium]
MLIETAPLWVAQTNTYVVATGRGEPAVIVDAPPDAEAIGVLCARMDVVPIALLATHGHVDHVGGAGAVVRATDGVTAYLHPDDDWLALDPVAQLRMLFGMVPPGDYEPPDHYEPLADGQRLDLAGVSFEVLHTPGHTPGHCCFHVAGEGVLFGGDLLFSGSIGRTDLPGGDFDTMMESLAATVRLPGETRVLSGHGPATTIARELAINPFLQTFS